MHVRAGPGRYRNEPDRADRPQRRHPVVGDEHSGGAHFHLRTGIDPAFRPPRIRQAEPPRHALIWPRSSGLDYRVEVANRAHFLQQRSEVQNGRLGQPAGHQLHIDRQSVVARAEPDRQAGQARHVQWHGRALDVGGVHGLAVDGELCGAMPLLEGISIVWGSSQYSRLPRTRHTAIRAPARCRGAVEASAAGWAGCDVARRAVREDRGMASDVPNIRAEAGHQFAANDAVGLTTLRRGSAYMTCTSYRREIE